MPGMILCVHETDLVCKGLMHSHPVLESVECRDDNELPNPAKKHKYDMNHPQRRKIFRSKSACFNYKESRALQLFKIDNRAVVGQF